MAATYEPIASQTLGSDTASVTFSGIAADWTDLVLSIAGRGTAALSSVLLQVQFNSDTGSNYSASYIWGDGSSAYSGRQSNVTYAPVGNMAAASATSNVFTPFALTFMSYANTNVYKTTLAANAISGTLVGRNVSLWRSTSAITSITLSPNSGNFATGCTFSLFGIKAA